MDFLEKDLEEIIETTYNVNGVLLMEKGLNIPLGQKMLRQKRIGNYGTADLITYGKDYPAIYDSENNSICGFDYNRSYLSITIYELKKDKIGISAFFQAIRYARGIQRYLCEHRNFYDFSINIILIGKEMDTQGSLCFLPDLFSSADEFAVPNLSHVNNISFYTYKYGIDGLNFIEEFDYSMIEEGFNDEI